MTNSVKKDVALPRRRQAQRQADEGEETVRTLRYIFYFCYLRIFQPQGTVSVILSLNTRRNYEYHLEGRR